MAKKNETRPEIGPVGNGGKHSIKMTEPYVATVRIRGVSDILFHRYDPESVAEKAAAKKGSAAKKTDDVQSFVYRNNKKEICIPGEYLRSAIAEAAKFRQDPRSPRKSARDLFKAVVLCETELASLGSIEWNYIHQCRAPLNGKAITRSRPAFKAGWEAEFQFSVIMPQYVSPETLHEVISDVGKLIGIGDFRPTYGRFQIVSFKIGLE